MGIVSILAAGLIATLLTVAIMQVRDRTGVVMTALLAATGSLCGALVVDFLIRERAQKPLTEFEPTVLFGSLFGALLCLAIFHLSRGRIGTARADSDQTEQSGSDRSSSVESAPGLLK